MNNDLVRDEGKYWFQGNIGRDIAAAISLAQFMLTMDMCEMSSTSTCRQTSNYLGDFGDSRYLQVQPEMVSARDQEIDMNASKACCLSLGMDFVAAHLLAEDFERGMSLPWRPNLLHPKRC